MDPASNFVREDSFDAADDEFRPHGGVTAGTAPLGRQPSTFSDSLSVGGEDGDGEGFWGRQCDPESGMAYYLNEKVGAALVLNFVTQIKLEGDGANIYGVGCSGRAGSLLQPQFKV